LTAGDDDEFFEVNLFFHKDGDSDLNLRININGIESVMSIPDDGPYLSRKIADELMKRCLAGHLYGPESYTKLSKQVGEIFYWSNNE
jgi:hypothetical protein